MKKTILTILALSVSYLVSAENSWLKDSKITELYTKSDNTAVVAFNNKHQATGCVSFDAAALDLSTDSGKQIMQSLRLAYENKSTVMAYLVDSQCIGDFPILNTLILK